MTFCLVHGAWHGAWCWYRCGAELEAEGATVVAPELPIGDRAAGCRRYAEVVEAALRDADDVVLVGHSLAGLVIPLVASVRPVRRLVYLAALIPQPGRSVREQEPGMHPQAFLDGVVRQDGLLELRPEQVASTFYNDCTAADAAWAAARLRPQAPAPLAEAYPLPALPDVAATYVVCRDDRVIDPDWSRREADPARGRARRARRRPLPDALAAARAGGAPARPLAAVRRSCRRLRPLVAGLLLA